jgi:hypothetical protein
MDARPKRQQRLPGRAAHIWLGKRVVCVDGYDMSKARTRELPLGRVLERKVRHRWRGIRPGRCSVLSRRSGIANRLHDAV